MVPKPKEIPHKAFAVEFNNDRDNKILKDEVIVPTFQTNKIENIKTKIDSECESNRRKGSNNIESGVIDSGCAADFEEAISAAGFGRFNYLLLFATMPAFWSSVYITSSPSYIFASAKCDLELSLLNMGMVNAMTYAGMVCSAMIWGYLSDTLGRKKIMVYGFTVSGLLEVTAGFTQSFHMLIAIKFFTGFFFNGPFAILLSYLSELHNSQTRSKLILYTSIFYTVANTQLPLLAWGIIPLDIDIFIAEGIVLRSWHVFLLLLGLAPLAAGLFFSQLPESPKFLMSRRRNEEALAVFRRIYRINTGLPEDTYPVKQLALEQNTDKRSDQPKPQGLEALKGGFAQLAPLFQKDHGPLLVLLCCIQIGAMFGLNTIRLWFPHVAAMMDDWSSARNEPPSFCQMLAANSGGTTAAETPDESFATCVQLETSIQTYTNSMIVSGMTVFSYILGGLLINKLGKRSLAVSTLFISACLIGALPWMPDGFTAIVASITLFQASVSLAGSTLHVAILDMFPTHLRVMATSIFLMWGRLGTISGNLAFPALIATGCLPPFLTLAGVMLCCCLGCILLPSK